MGFKIEDSSADFLEAYKNAVVDSVESALDMAEKEVRATCPVRTGNMRLSFQFEDEYDDKTIHAQFGTNIFYAPFVIYGTRKQSPNPFFVISAENFRNNIEKEMDKNLKKL